jgi:hypothetical protein
VFFLLTAIDSSPILVYSLIKIICRPPGIVAERRKKMMIQINRAKREAAEKILSGDIRGGEGFFIEKGECEGFGTSSYKRLVADEVIIQRAKEFLASHK